MLEQIDQVFVHGAHAVVDLLKNLGLPAWAATIVALILPAAACVVVWPAFFAFLTWMERKVLSRIQNRYGPNRVGPYGLLQPIADGMKILSKEDIIPRAADKLIHTLAPITIVVVAIVLFSLLPYGRNMVPADMDVSLLMFFALSSIATLGLFWAGWGSRNKFSLLGAMRAVSQMIAYELPVVMSAVPAVMIAGSMQLSAIVEAQGPVGEVTLVGSVAHWFVWKPWGFVSFIAFFIAGMAELNRSPFDIAEGESEIVAGFHTEYSGFKFAMFQMGEYMAAIAFSGLASTIFLGGWWGPAFLPSWLWFFGKILFLMSMMMWIRGTLPRLRADQLMGFSWKLLLPLAFCNVLSAGVWHVIPKETLPLHVLAYAVSAVISVGGFFFFGRLAGSPIQNERRVYKFATFDGPAPTNGAPREPAPAPAAPPPAAPVKGAA